MYIDMYSIFFNYEKQHWDSHHTIFLATHVTQYLSFLEHLQHFHVLCINNIFLIENLGECKTKCS
jgi:hypothetical protein